MGRRGPLPNRNAVGHRAPAQIVRLVPGVKVAVPTPPDGLLPVTRKRWRTFWQSPKAQLVSPDSRPALERLFRIYDDLEREGDTFRSARLVKGSVGQIRLNPLGAHLLMLEQTALRLEVEFGLTPLSASRLGIAFGEASRSLDDLNRRLSAEYDEDVDDDDDPTAALLVAGSDAGRAAAAEPRG